VLFARTPYATAPLEVQQRVLRNAQAILARGGFYRDIVDGLPGPATEEALLTYQRSARLTLTGRLDMETLATLRLLPANTLRNPPPTTQRVYRGIWVN
jgi:peptidoglycan hydrolase-like protein with peptidoglycan-binding domain